ncbi:MAG TPA: hypothetical protein VLG12_00180 [Candidatus Saccharimonadales bacterium]|nr:hypothetical protein [Candidatus Saccharimonadales bacterium]
MIHFTLATQDFKLRQKEIALIHNKAFAEFPWFFDATDEEVTKHISEIISKKGFEAFLAYKRNRTIVGVLTYDVPSIPEFKQEWGEDLASFSALLLKEHSINALIWEREVFVLPEYQGEKIGNNLRKSFLSYLQLQYPQGVLVLTRMRDDNVKIIHIAEKLGYQRTGIKTASTKKRVKQEYWYKLLLP